MKGIQVYDGDGEPIDFVEVRVTCLEYTPDVRPSMQVTGMEIKHALRLRLPWDRADGFEMYMRSAVGLTIHLLVDTEERRLADMYIRPLYTVTAKLHLETNVEIGFEVDS